MWSDGLLANHAAAFPGKFGVPQGYLLGPLPRSPRKLFHGVPEKHIWPSITKNCTDAIFSLLRYFTIILRTLNNDNIGASKRVSLKDLAKNFGKGYAWFVIFCYNLKM